ncbi:MAG: AraC family transcriptional regulator [Phaeodactylibacter sp.]|nr:AraC family transcriptional regulator [Phaeodactylibacter sp.]
MEITFDGKNILLIAAIVQGLVMGSILLFKTAGNRRANRILGFLLIGVSLNTVDLFFSLSGIFGQNPDLYMLPIYFSFAFGPLLYFYVHALTRPKATWSNYWWVHFVPVLIQFVFYGFLSLQTYEYKSMVWGTLHQPYTYPFENYFADGSFLVYWILSIRELFRYQKALPDRYSSLESVTLEWLQYFIFLTGFLWIVGVLEPIIHEAMDWHPFHINHIALPFMLYWIGVAGLLGRPRTIEQATEPEPEFEVEAPEPEPIAESATDNEALSQYLPRLRQLMEEDQLFLQAELKLGEVSDRLGVHTKVLSAIINSCLGKNFHDFVNEYRIEEVKRRILDPAYDHWSLLGIALDCGFNSKATFNRIFKKFTGYTPRAFKMNALARQETAVE